MSMHIIKGVYAPKSKKRKPKKLDMKKVEVQWRQYNKDMRRNHMHSCQFDTLDEYVLYISGKLKPKKKEFVPYVPQFLSRIINQSRRRAQFMEFQTEEEKKKDKSTQETTSSVSPQCISPISFRSQEIKTP